MSQRFAQLVTIHGFPLKGFVGEVLSRVELTPGLGLPDDRGWAILNGSEVVRADTPWHKCAAFVRMTREPSICLFRLTRANNNELTLHHPNGEQLKLNSQSVDNEMLSRWFGYPQMGLKSLNSGSGYWDHCDAKVSIINLTTVKAISQAAGIDIDPTRFRGNLLIETEEPWQELALAGQTITVGETQLEVLRPIDRCKGTSIDLDSGQQDVNMPYLLSSVFGHIYCGVYARVIKGGLVVPGDDIQVVDQAPQAIKDASKIDTAPATYDWPRAMRVIKRVDESLDVTSFYLEDPFAHVININAPAGYLKIHLNNKYRCYTLSGWSKHNNQLRVSVKREQNPNGLSQALHSDIKQDDQLIVSGPFVSPPLTLLDERDWQRPVLILTAGIGITVAASVLRFLSNNNSQADIRVGHVSRYEKTLALWQDIQQLTLSLKNAQSQVFFTRENFELQGLLQHFSLDKALVFLCGPAEFMASLKSQLLALGAAPQFIYQDKFVSFDYQSQATKAQAVNPRRSKGPLNINFSSDGREVQWTRQSGSLLDLADDNDIVIPANCRSGACNACLKQVKGRFEYIRQPVSQLPDDWAHLCCAVPLEDMVIL